MPERFRLQFPTELVDVKCSVASCNDNMSGIQFIAHARVTKPTPREKPQPTKKKPSGFPQPPLEINRQLSRLPPAD